MVKIIHMENEIKIENSKKKIIEFSTSHRSFSTTLAVRPGFRTALLFDLPKVNQFFDANF